MQYRFNKSIESIRRVCGIEPEEKVGVIACVSGGADSICMLELLRNSYDILLVAAHVNFHLRGVESDSDQRLVEEYCSRYSIPLHIKHFDTAAYALEKEISIEMAARELRYQWFEELRKELNYTFIAVAHNANDNAETMLLNLTRGTGLRGVCGMKGSGGNNSAIIRPMLQFERSEIVKFLTKNRIAYANDSTNASNEYKRNRIRNLITPQLLKMNPAFIATMNDNAAHFQAAFEVLEGVKESIFKRVCIYDLRSYVSRTGAGRRGCRVQEYMELILEDSFVQAIDIQALLEERGWRYWLFEWLCEYGANSSQCNSLIDSIGGDAQKRGTAAKVIETATCTIVFERGLVKVFKRVEKDLCSSVRLDEKEEYTEISWGGKERLRIKKTSLEELVVRKANNGERFQPLGMSRGTKKVSDLFTDLKIESFIRRELPVVSYHDEIVAIPGIEVSEKFRLP